MMGPPTMSNQEAIEMMSRCEREIAALRATIAQLQPKADAYDNIAIILDLLPKRSQGMSEDLAWVLRRRIEELTKADGVKGEPGYSENGTDPRHA